MNTCERRLFYIPSFKIYGSVAGFYDYGPPGCAIKGNVTALWRQHFVLEESMLEVLTICKRPPTPPLPRPSPTPPPTACKLRLDVVAGDLRSRCRIRFLSFSCHLRSA